jgi:putative membrane protein
LLCLESIRKDIKKRRIVKMLGMIIRFIVSAIVLLLVGFLVPGFAVAGFWWALVAAIAIAIIGYLVEALFGKNISPQNRGIVGFLTAAVVIYLSQFIVPGITVTIFGALLASLVIGIIDAFVPTKLR